MSITLVCRQSSLTSYQYDDANRIFFENSDGTMIYHYWDNNGNLIYNGAFSHVYDAANRLTTRPQLSDPHPVAFYRYNGLGDRLQDGFYGGSTTTCTMDLNAGLTQVLSDGANTYLYGVDHLAQMDGESTEYFLTDGLGSVRQLVDGTGNISLGKNYDPYGTVAQSFGSGTSPFGYTGEGQDANGLVYLRARYYSSDMGRFLTKDTWMGDYNRPLSLNRWSYTEGNPINYTDPTGHCPAGNAGEACRKLARTLETRYGFTIYWPERQSYYFIDDYGRFSVDHIGISGCQMQLEDGSWASVGPEKLATAWTESKLQQVQVGLEKIERIIGYFGTYRLTSRGVLFVMNYNAPSGIYCPAGNCDRTKLGWRLSFSRYEYAMGFYNWLDDKYGANDLGRASTVLHEYGHRANSVFNKMNGVKIENDIAKYFILADNKSSYPSHYAQDGVSEYFAETFRRFIWDQTEAFSSGCNHGRSTAGYPTLMDIKGTTDMGDETLHDYFNRVVILGLKSGNARPDLKPVICQ